MLTRDIALAAGVPGGLGSLMAVLRSMEDAGDLLRGMFVEGLGPAQFAARETVDALRTYAADGDAQPNEHAQAPRSASVEGEQVHSRAHSRIDTVVLAADDPASLFGIGFSWPFAAGAADDAGEAVAGAADEESRGGAAPGEAAGEGEPSDRVLRPSRRSGSLVVVRGGRPVLYATSNLRSILSFSGEPAALADGAHALAVHVQRAIKREGESGARKKVLVEEFDGSPVLDTAFAAILQHEGFVRLPDGMRLYASPF